MTVNPRHCSKLPWPQSSHTQAIYVDTVDVQGDNATIQVTQLCEAWVGERTQWTNAEITVWKGEEEWVRKGSTWKISRSRSLGFDQCVVTGSSSNQVLVMIRGGGIREVAEGDMILAGVKLQKINSEGLLLAVNGELFDAPSMSYPLSSSQARTLNSGR